MIESIILFLAAYVHGMMNVDSAIYPDAIYFYVGKSKSV